MDPDLALSSLFANGKVLLPAERSSEDCDLLRRDFGDFCREGCDHSAREIEETLNTAPKLCNCLEDFHRSVQDD